MVQVVVDLTVSNKKELRIQIKIKFIWGLTNFNPGDTISQGTWKVVRVWRDVGERSGNKGKTTGLHDLFLKE